MKSFVVTPASRLKGEITLPGDKSIAHRAILVSAISQGKTTIRHFPANKDCLYTLGALQKLGVKISATSADGQFLTVTVRGNGLRGLKKTRSNIFGGDSGTTFRLLLGILAGQDFKVRLIAGKSLSKRPMLRVTQPLRMMGAKIDTRHKTQDTRPEEYPPITIRGGNLQPITYKMPVASAQVKSAILLAGLYAKGNTQVIEPVKTRDHTERMLELFKASIKLKRNAIVIKGNQPLVSPGRITIPGDISSASFFLVLAAILPNSRLIIRNVGLNPSRNGVMRVLKRMGAKIKVSSLKSQVLGVEPLGDIIIKSSLLKGTVVKKEEIPSLIDELPILIVAACNARGITVFEGVGELRVKETDRIRSMSENLRKMGADIVVSKTGSSEKIIIKGVKQLKGVRVRSFGDHRTAMSMVVAGLNAQGKTYIDDIICINKSFPDFLNLLGVLIK